MTAQKTTPGTPCNPCAASCARFCERILPRAKIPSKAALVLGLAACVAASIHIARAAPAVVINEIHFHPPEKRASEFVELYNPGTQPVDVGRWKLDKFVFPDGVVLAPGSYAVIAMDPAAFKKEFGFAPLGPLPGRLKHRGETLRVEDRNGATVDAVRYASGFPWPTAASGEGSSLERVHPQLASQKPSSWRSSGHPVVKSTVAPFLAASDTAWRWRPGTSEASMPRDLWRSTEFTEDASWKTAKLSIGYGDDDDNTVVNDMQGRYTSLFLRRIFTLENASETGPLLARIRVDDGCILWLNGVEILRLNLPPGDLAFDAVATDHEASRDFENHPLPDAARHLRKGVNVLCAQVFNASKDSSDLTFDFELRTQRGAPIPKTPTPGKSNSVFETQVAPGFLEVRHLPKMPRSDEPVRVTAQAEPGMQAVVLEYQIVEPGAYVRRTDADFETRWKSVPMNDAGLEGDAVAGDGIFTATLAAEVQQHRRLVRYRVRGRDAENRVATAPREDDTCPNFGWFVYNGLPEFRGSLRPGQGPELRFSSEFLSTLPAYHLIAARDEVARSQWDGGFHRKPFLGTLVVDGVVQDHVVFHNRGQGSAHISGKNKWGIRLDRHHPLEAKRNDGTPYRHAWNSLNLNPGLSTPYLPVLCGIGGLDEALSFRAYQLAGVPSANTHWIQWRVICDARESEPDNPYAGDLWGLYLAVQDMDGDWLKERDLSDGNVYSTQSGRKHLARGAVADRSDWGAFSNGVRQDHPEAWWREHLDLPAYFSFHAFNRLLANVDLRPDGNHGYYRNAEGRWAPVPWDLDMMFVPRHHQPGIIDAVRCLNVPVLKREYRNRAREILDLFCADASEQGGQIGQLIAELSGYVHPRGFERNWAELDAVHWNYHPRKNGHGLYFQQVAFGDHFGGRWERRIESPDFAGFCRYLLNFTTDARPEKNYQPNDGNPLGYGFGYLANEAQENGIPERPVVTRTGPDSVEVSAFVSPQGTAFRALEWRLAEIGVIRAAAQAPPRFAYELEAGWTRRCTTDGERRITPPAGLFEKGRTYRLRARYEDAEHRASRWSEPVLFTPSA